MDAHWLSEKRHRIRGGEAARQWGQGLTLNPQHRGPEAGSGRWEGPVQDPLSLSPTPANPKLPPITLGVCLGGPEAAGPGPRPAGVCLGGVTQNLGLLGVGPPTLPGLAFWGTPLCQGMVSRTQESSPFSPPMKGSPHF